MFNIGIFELLVIFFFFLILVKPSQYSDIFKEIGLLYRKLNKHVSNLKYELSLEDKKSNVKKKKIIKNVILRSFKRT